MNEGNESFAGKKGAGPSTVPHKDFTAAHIPIVPCGPLWRAG